MYLELFLGVFSLLTEQVSLVLFLALNLPYDPNVLDQLCDDVECEHTKRDIVEHFHEGQEIATLSLTCGLFVIEMEFEEAGCRSLRLQHHRDEGVGALVEEHDLGRNRNQRWCDLAVDERIDLAELVDEVREKRFLHFED